MERPRYARANGACETAVQIRVSEAVRSGQSFQDLNIEAQPIQDARLLRQRTRNQGTLNRGTFDSADGRQHTWNRTRAHTRRLSG